MKRAEREKRDMEIAKLRLSGMTINQICDAVPYSHCTVRKAYRKHLSGDQQASVKAVTLRRGCMKRRFGRAPEPNVIIKPTIKETAIANYGRCSASQIAEAVGTTRNAVIGYWNRNRSALEAH
jgi:hypothetical protein